jgi:hypothetical protein
MSTKICTRCEIEKDIKEFWKSSSTKDGRRYHCKQCEAEKRLLKGQEDVLKHILQATIARAKTRNIPCDSFEDLYNYLKPIFDRGECEYCHKQLETGIGKGKPSNNSPSIDRVIPHGGYWIGNVAILCNRCNCKKQDNTLQDFQNWASWMEEHMADFYAYYNYNNRIETEKYLGWKYESRYK